MDFAVVQLGPIFQDELVLRRGTLEFIGKPFEDYLVDPLLLAEWFVVCPICLLVLSALWLVSESLMRQAQESWYSRSTEHSCMQNKRETI